MNQKQNLWHKKKKNFYEWVEKKGYHNELLIKLIGGFYLNVVMPFKEFALRKGWVWILLFVVTLKVGDAMAGVMTPSLLVELGFTKTELAFANKTLGLVALLVGTFLGGVLLNVAGTYRGLMISGVLMMLTNLNFILLREAGHDVYMLAYTIGFENLATGIGGGVLVSYLSGLCNIGYTATQYALLSSLASMMRGTFGISSGELAERLGWDMFFVFTAVIAVPALFILMQLKKAGGVSDDLRDHSHT